MDPLERDVLAANEAFYRAFRERNLAAMEQLWSRDAPIAVLHPGMAAIRGRADVMASWRGILGHPDAPHIAPSDAVAHVLGTSAFVTCFEGTPGQSPRLVATNVFLSEDGHWRMVLHQAGPLNADASRRQPRTPDTGHPPKDPRDLN